MVAPEFEFDQPLTRFEQPLQFEHALARDDDLPPCRNLRIELGLGQGQAVAVGRHAAQGVFAHVEQQAIQVVADILVRHREGGPPDQVLQCCFGKTDALDQIDVVDHRELARRQGRQREPAASGTDRNPVAVLLDLDLGPVGQGAADIEQLACRNRHFAFDQVIRRGARDHLDLEVGTGERHLRATHVDQQIRQYRQGLAPFDDANDLLQRFQQGFPRQNEAHDWSLPVSGFGCNEDLWW